MRNTVLETTTPGWKTNTYVLNEEEGIGLGIELLHKSANHPVSLLTKSFVYNREWSECPFN